jgi:hypothetical protein
VYFDSCLPHISTLQLQEPFQILDYSKSKHEL